MTSPVMDVEFDEASNNNELRLEAQMLETLPSGGFFDFDKFMEVTTAPQDPLSEFLEPRSPSEQQSEPQQTLSTPPSLSFTQRVLGSRFSGFPKRATTTNDLRLINNDTDSHTGSNFGRNSLGNATMVNTPTPPDEHLYSQDDFLGGLGFDLDSNSLAFADSTTLASEGRPSYDLSSDAGLRQSTEYIDSLRPNDVPLPMKQRITNSINSMFKMSNNNGAGSSTTTTSSRFNLRSMNPLSHRDESNNSHLQHLSNLAEDSENIYLDVDNAEMRKKLEKGPLPKKKRIFFNGARIPFMKSQQPSNANADPSIPDDQYFDYNDELSRVISMASLNSSSYNFHDAMRLSTDAATRASMDAVSLSIQQVNEQLDLTSLHNHETVDDAFANISLENADNASDFMNDLNFGEAEEGSGSGITATLGEDEDEEVGGLDAENHSPDYAALFSDVKSKKRSKTSLPSFRKKNVATAVTTTTSTSSASTASSSTSATSTTTTPTTTATTAQPQVKLENTIPSIPTITTTTADASTTETILPPLPEGMSLPIVPPADEPPRRGRKPTLEYDASKQFVCSYCLRRFRRQEHLKRHFRSLHTNEKPFDCNLCGKKFSRNDNLAQHIKTHTEGGDDVIEE